MYDFQILIIIVIFIYKRFINFMGDMENATSGKKAHNESHYIKIGRVRLHSWMNEKLPAADIIISTLLAQTVENILKNLKQKAS